MNTLYLTFKFLHIVGAIVWLGGMVAVSILSALIARESSRAVLGTMVRLNQSFGARIVGPAAGLTLVAGFLMVALGGLGGPLWVIWGFLAIIISILLGATVMRATSSKLGAQLSSAAGGDGGDAELRRLQRQMAFWGVVNLLVLFSAEWAMIFKPTF